MAGRRGLAVAGAHGKSTTSAMLVAALGDASAAVGATIAGGGGTGALWGAGPWFVAEADESDRSLLNLAPEAAILLNVDHDHHATFASLEDVRDVFREFVARLPARGLLVVGPDDEARACARGARCPVRRRGRRARGLGARRARPRPARLRPGPGRRRAGRGPAGPRRAPQRRQRGLRPRAGRLVRRPPPGGRPARWRASPGWDGGWRRAAAPAASRWSTTTPTTRPRSGRRWRPPASAARGAWSWCSSPTCPRARGRSGPRSAPRSARRTSSWSPTSTSRASRPTRRPPAGTSPRGCPAPPRVVHAPSLAEAAEAALAEVRPGDLLITMGAGDVTLLGKELVARLEKQSVDGDPDDRSRPA